MMAQQLAPAPAGIPDRHLARTQRGLVVAKAYYFFLFAAIGAFVPYFNIFLEARGLSGTQIGWLASIPPLISLLANPFWGGIADRWQIHRLVLAFCALMTGVASLFFLQAGGFAMLMVLVIALFIFRSPIGVILDSAVVDMTAKVGATYGRQRVWGTFGFILATYGLGRIISDGNLDWAFWIHGLFFGVVCAILSLLLPIPRTTDRVDLWGGLRTLLGHADYRTFLIACIFMGMGMTGLINFMGLHILALGGTESQVGLAFAATAVAEIPIMILGAGWFARYSNARLILIGSLGYTLVFFAMALVQTPVQLIVVTSFIGICYGTFWVAAVGYAGQCAPLGLSATAQALFGAALFGLGWSIGALTAGLLWDWTNGHVLFLVLSGFGATATLIFYRGTQRARIEV